MQIFSFEFNSMLILVFRVDTGDWKGDVVRRCEANRRI